MDDSSDILQDIPPIVLKEFINNLKNDFPAALHDTFNGSIYVQDEEAAKMLLDALMKTQKIPYQNVKITNLSGLTDSAFTIMENLTTTPEWCTTKEPLFYLPWSTAQKMEVDLPEGVEIQYLTKEHASKIDTFWPYRFPGSKELIEDMIDLNFGLGIFKDEALISWALVWYYGGIGSVHTLEEERRKGYGRAVVQAITKKMGNMEIDVHVLTVEDNTSGENFFKALGFKYGLTTFCRWRPNPWPLPLYN